VTGIAYTVHTELSFYERWLRHSMPTAEEGEARRQAVDRKFIAERIKLGAIQAEIDAYFGMDNEPGNRLHRLADLMLLRYAVILDVPQSQLAEIVDHLGAPRHSGYSRNQLSDLLESPKPTDTAIWIPLREIETACTMALHDALSALLENRPLSKSQGFRSTKMLTDDDQLSAVQGAKPLKIATRPVSDKREEA
jgi:hypothetical protein